jgi:hypothetical protein
MSVSTRQLRALLLAIVRWQSVIAGVVVAELESFVVNDSEKQKVSKVAFS